MARLSWQEFVRRFPVMEARFVGCQLSLPRQDGSFTVALYEGNESEVTFYAKTVRQVNLSEDLNYEPIELEFTQQHPLLLDYEWQGSIVCLSLLTLDQWRQIAAEVQEALTGYNREVSVADYASRQVEQWGHAGSFELGKFPLPLYQALLPVLNTRGIRYFLPFKPEPTLVPVLFLIDGDNYIIADDFEWGADCA